MHMNHYHCAGDGGGLGKDFNLSSVSSGSLSSKMADVMLYARMQNGRLQVETHHDCSHAFALGP